MNNEAPLKRVGISMLEQLEATIKVGMALGFNMDGCEATLEKIITEIGDETKLVRVDLWTLRQKQRIICVDNYVVVKGCWIQNGVKIMFIAVYAPQSLAGKIDLWSSLSRLISKWDGQVIVMGDFNEVREAGERYGTKFNKRQGDMFNSFITNSNLIDVPLGGFRFTWTDKWASKMSKLDRFLVSEGFYDTFPLLTGIVLEKGIPDHRPILLKESAIDYGLTLFRFFHSWLDIEGFHDLVVVQNIATREDLIDRAASMKIIGDIDRKEASDLVQKTKIKWDIEGDENTSFFHGTLKKKRRQNDIKRVLKNGIWIEDPGEVKAEFYEHFRSRFSYTSGDRPCLGDVPLNRLSCQQRDFLESDFLNDEIKMAVWECGGDRTPGPDGFTFNFIKVF
ncbi:RNA-directed DNA polymerase, eukaryota [Tanacetum coccineum]